MSVEDIREATHNAKFNLQQGMCSVKMTDANFAVMSTQIGSLLQNIAESDVPNLFTLTEKVSENGCQAFVNFVAATECINYVGDDEAARATHTNEQKYSDVLDGVNRINMEAIETLGRLASVAEELTALRDKIGSVRENLKEVGGTWNSGAIAGFVGRVVGQESTPGTVGVAVDAINNLEGRL